MCDPTLGLLTASLIVAVASIATTAVTADRQADNQERLADAQFEFEDQQAKLRAAEAQEAAAEERSALAEEAARARGVAQTSGLGDRSLASFLRDISRREGRSNALIDRNLELAARQTQALQQGSALSRAGKLLDIDAGRPSAAVVGLQIGSTVLGGAAGIYGEHRRQNQPVSEQEG